MKLIELTSLNLGAKVYFAVDKICSFTDGCIWNVESTQAFECRESAAQIISKIEYAEYLEAHKAEDSDNEV